MSDRIFISYGHEDEEFVLRLARDLEGRGAQVWIDRGDLHPGVEWQRSIANAIANCQAFLLVVSKDSLASTYVNQEMALAEAHQKTIFPLIYE
ncbi:MAG: toll/interleukin-1 receptor domain-containing protein, partial [Anaerolineales bacterium]|nr:toll/interleukin-1 receptor domain-containing protein [Anaerolineales bacterium]